MLKLLNKVKVIYKKYHAGQDIPVFDHVSKRKLTKYYTRETMAAAVALGELYGEQRPSADTPFFYSTGELEFMDYFREVCNNFRKTSSKCFFGRRAANSFSGAYFIEKVMPRLSPLSQFKIMRNMPHCLIALEYGLKGENALFLDSLQGLLYSAKMCEYDGPLLIGAGKLYADGGAESGFAEILPGELDDLPLASPEDDPLAFFKRISQSLCV